MQVLNRNIKTNIYNCIEFQCIYVTWANFNTCANIKKTINLKKISKFINP